MAELPRGTVTLLFTDIEGSTRLLQELGEEAYVRALEDHRRLLREAFTAHGGVEVEMQGDSFHFAFTDPCEAVLAASEAQRTLAEHAWERKPIRVRIGIHTGEPLVTGHLYAGLDVHRAARVMSAGHGGQVLLSERTSSLVEKSLPEGLSLRDMGRHRLKDLSAPQGLFQLGDEEFPSLETLYQTNLPVPATPFLGRERELQEVSALLADEATRLLTLTGAGGSGKTRLAAQAAADVSELFPDGVFWVGLAALREPALVTSTIAQVVGAKGELAEHVGAKRLLLLLDNFEHVLAAATELAELLVACPKLTLLVTSRESLHLSGEREYVVLPLREADAISLFHERVRAAGVELAANGEVREICRRLDHLPLAIELAAARTKVRSPRALLEQLERRLPLLTGGARDLPERQRTLRSTIAWSYELLGAEEQRLFARLAVFAGGCTLDAAEEICEADLDTLQSLVEKSLLRHTDGRFWMLETIREFAGERLEESGEADAVRRLHAAVLRGARGSTDMRDLRGRDAALWLQRFEDEHDNFRSVLEYLLENGDSSTALRARRSRSRGSGWCRGHLAEGRRWLETTLEAVSRFGDAAAGAPRSGAHRDGARRLRRAAEAAAEALTLDREEGDEEGAAQSMLVARGHRRLQRRPRERGSLVGGGCGFLAARGDIGWSLRSPSTTSGTSHGSRSSWDRRRRISKSRARTSANSRTSRARRELSSASCRSHRSEATSSVRLSMLAVATELYGAFGMWPASSTRLSSMRRCSKGWTNPKRQRGCGGRVTRWAGSRPEADHPLELAAHDEAVARVRLALGDDAFERAWERGSAMTLDEAVAFALEQRSPVPEPN